MFGFDEDSDEGASSDIIPLADLPETDAHGKASFAAALDQSAGFDAAARSHDRGAHGGARRPRGRAQHHPPDHAAASHDRREAALHRQVARRLRHGELRRGHGGAGRQAGRRSKGSIGNCCASIRKYQWYRSDGYWQYEPIKVTRRVADGTIDVAAGSAGRISVPVTWGRYRLEVSSGDPQGPETTFGFDSGWYAEASADTPDLLEIALDKPEYKPGDSMTVAVTARTAGK